MLLNISNHPFERWSDKQKQTAIGKFGQVKDIPFPNIDPDWDTREVESRAKAFFHQIIEQYPAGFFVHLMGELTFTFALVGLFQQAGITCYASTTHRIVEERSDEKIVKFRFVRFRAYPILTKITR